MTVLWLALGVIGVAGVFTGSKAADRAFGTVIWAVAWGYAYISWRAFHITPWRDRLVVGTSLRFYALRRVDIAAVEALPGRDLYGRLGAIPVITLRSGKRIRLNAFITPKSTLTKNSYANDAVATVEDFAGRV